MLLYFTVLPYAKEMYCLQFTIIVLESLSYLIKMFIRTCESVYWGKSMNFRVYSPLSTVRLHTTLVPISKQPNS